MEPEKNNKSGTDASELEQSVSFQHVSSVATGWMVDFMFRSLCRHFKEAEFEEFNETLSVFEAISKSPALKEDVYSEKILICAFLARVMHGKQLDVLFEEDQGVMPLMSATKIWSNLEDTVADETVFKNITNLLVVQSVAVCLEKGERSSASSALKWFENNDELPQKVGVKLKTIVAQTETYHPLLMSFSFNHLLETVRSYLEVYLEKNPSDDLLKEATKRVLSSQGVEGLKDKVKHESSHSETADESMENDLKTKESTVCLGTKRKLLSTKITEVWKPESGKKPCVSIRRISKSELTQILSEKSMDSTDIQKKRKAHQKWTLELDKYLKAGVRLHGPGKWSRILMDYDFEGRTGTMLKDRWRVLMRANEVC
ncbi:telomeric repeat-binding factor 1 [Hippoglossus hippoglossus]|uniref:telomeric repeat-binding factor 1 n=1 Tax=Hippoglossus hippoglossus TaxID=8267 RepID=UPI00148D4FEE|nr:telomeric repeat-binding factor 1 [Hippoglossus hippoglossus]